jgi:hypothetical protein
MTMLEDLREVVRLLDAAQGAREDMCLERLRAISSCGLFIRTHAAQIEQDARDAEQLRNYIKIAVPCTCLWSGHVRRDKDGSMRGESKLTAKCRRCQILDAAMAKESGNG